MILSRGSRRWVSYHIFVNSHADLFIKAHLRTFVTRERDNRAIRRFFFIRYSENGLHLRTRFLFNDASVAGRIRSELSALLDGFRHDGADPGTGIRIESATYDRTEHYFGNNMLTVYAELLNECTTRIAFDLLQPDFGGRQRRVLVAACAVWSCVSGAFADAANRARFLTAADLFVRKASTQFGSATTGLNDSDQAKFDRNLLRIQPAFRRDCDQSLLNYTGRMLRRTITLPTQGWSVGIHSIHLLNNKLGVSLQEERYIYNALKRLISTQAAACEVV